MKVFAENIKSGTIILYRTEQYKVLTSVTAGHTFLTCIREGTTMLCLLIFDCKLKVVVTGKFDQDLLIIENTREEL